MSEIRRNERARMAALEHMDAVRADADGILQELTDDVREIFGADLAVVHLMLSDSLYFRAWSGPLPDNFVESREISAEQSMCPNVIETAAPLIVEDLLASERFRDHFICTSAGLRFYAGTPLIASSGEVIGTLCLLGARPREFGEPEMTTLSAFARAVMGRLELLGALRRESAAREEEARRGEELRRTLDQSLDMITTIGFDGVCRSINRACEQVLGYRPQELVGRHHLEVVHPDDRERATEAARRLFAGETVALFQTRYVRKDGGTSWVEWSATPLPDEGVYHCVARDITARRTAEEALRRAEEKYRLIFENAAEGIFQTSAAGELLTANPAMARMFGYGCPDEMVAAVGNVVELYESAAAHRDFVESILKNDFVSDFECRVHGREGRPLWVAMNARVLRDGSGAVAGYEGTVEDITRRKELEERLEYQAFHDALTDLPNRAHFTNRLQYALNAAGERGDAVAVLFLDLDNFKLINDSLGHDAGDRLLVEVARRLRSCLRADDTAARFGGDEFTVLMERVSGVEEALGVARRIIAEFEDPFDIRGHEVFATTSVGISLGLCPGADAVDLMRQADAAMYRAKGDGRARFATYESEMGVLSLQRLKLESDLKRAIEQGELRVHYQPKAVMETGAIVGAEALVRWEHPERGLLSPAEFISVAEETGLIVPLGLFVLREACRQAGQWRRLFAGEQPLEMSVNISPRQLREPSLPDRLAEILREAELPAGTLTLEIGEGALADDGAGMQTLQRLKALGVRIAVDDFGAFGSLSHLRRLPTDLVKIDRRVVSGVESDAGDAAVVAATVILARALNLEVVAEGVETASGSRKLRALGCDLGQGYLWHLPLAPDEITALLAERATATVPTL